MKTGTYYAPPANVVFHATKQLYQDVVEEVWN